MKQATGQRNGQIARIAEEIREWEEETGRPAGATPEAVAMAEANGRIVDLATGQTYTPPTGPGVIAGAVWIPVTEECNRNPNG